MKTTSVVIAFLLISAQSFAQTTTKPLTIEEAVNIALQNNPQIKSARLDIRQQNILKKTAVDIPKTNFSILNGQYNSKINDNNYTVTQDFSFPTVYARNQKLQKQHVVLSEKALALTQIELVRNVRAAYYQLSFGLEKLKLLNYQDSIYEKFLNVAALKYKTGETSNLEKLSAESKYQQLQIDKQEAEADIVIYQKELQNLLVTKNEILITDNKLQKQTLLANYDTAAIKQNPLLDYYNQKIVVANSQISLEKSKFLPDLSVGYFNQSLDGVTGFQGVQFGIGVPIFYGAQKARVRASKIQTQILQADYENYKNNYLTAFNQGLQEYKKLNNALSYYESSGLQQADEILRITQLSYRKGEIGYVEYIQNLTQAVSIKMKHVETLNQLNQTVIKINYLTGGK